MGDGVIRKVELWMRREELLTDIVGDKEISGVPSGFRRTSKNS